MIEIRHDRQINAIKISNFEIMYYHRHQFVIKLNDYFFSIVHFHVHETFRISF